MKPYGVKRCERGCCPGHDKFDGAYTNTPRKRIKARRRPAKKRPRQAAKKVLWEDDFIIIRFDLI